MGLFSQYATPTEPTSTEDPLYSSNESQEYANYQPAPDNGGGYQQPQEQPYYEQPQQQYEQQPMEEPETGRAWDIHYTPSWFVEEQQNRKNPDYEKDANWTDEAVDAIANYVSGKKDANPNEWRYGDPGWDRATQLWQETIKPVENAYQEEQKRQQAEAPKPQETQYYSFHNNNVNTTDLAIRQEGNELAPIRSADEVEKIKESSPYQLHKVDTTLADYDTLSNSGKFNQTFMPGTAGTDVKNQKWYQRWTQPVLGAFMSASGPANIAKLAFTALGGPVGWAYGIAWGGTAAYSYLKGTGVIKGNEYLDKVIELTDILDEKGAQAQGALAYGWEKAGGGDFTDWSKFGENLDFFTNNFSTIMHYAFGEGKASSEYNADVVGVVTGLTPNMGANAIGIQGQGASRLVRSVLSQVVDNPEDKIWLQRNQTTRNNVGLEGVYEIPEELLGTNAITYWLNYGQWLYDHGITNTKQLEFEIGNAINEVYGDLANYSEFIEHELGDPGNAMEGMQSRALGLYGQVTGDVNLANAAKANTGSLAMDLAGQVPGLQGLIETVGRFAGKEIRSSGGIDEVINAWDMENLQSDPSQLTARDRRISGINEDGSLKSLDVLKDPNTIKNPFARGAEKIKQLFQTAPEWRASMAGDSIMNFISAGIEDALSARPNENAQARIDRVIKFVDELEHPETISSTSPFSKPSKTVLFNSIKEDLSLAIRTRRAEINKVIEDYAKLEPNRQVLNTLANALGLTPKKVLDKYESQKTVLAQMIINKADENGGKIPGIVDANGQELNVESREFGDRVIAMIAPFAGKDAKPYDPRAMMTQVTTKIGDGVTETMINKYNIKSEGWVYRFGDTVKKLQQLWLLGLSPSYLANNVVNNVLTRSALGYGGLMTPKTINDWTDRFGFTPERFAESMSDQVLETQKGEQTASQKMQQAIRAERKGKHKVLDNIDSKLDWVSQHAGLFGWLSGKVEENESKQIYTSAMMTYMARTWKPGVNYRKMDSRLENLIRSQNPAMLDAIYSAINSGVNMAEIENAIYGTFVIPNIQETLVDTARKIGITDAEDVIIEMFTKGGLLAELQQALNGKRGDEIDAVISNVITRAKAIAQIQLAEDLARRAEQVANDTKGYGFAEAVQLGQDMADDMANVWIASQDANTQIFNRRLQEGMKTAEFRALYLEHQKVLNERWDAVYRTVQQNYLGILNGLGFTNETTQKYIDTMRQRDALWSNFYQKTQPETIQPYLDALVWRKDDTFETWDSRVVKAWKDYTKAIKTKYNETLTSEQDLQIQMDQTFADGLRVSLSDADKGKVDSVIIPLQTKIREQRQKIVEKNRELRSTADNTNILNEKNNVYKEAQAERAELVNEYRRLQKQLYDEIRAIGPKTVASSGDSATAEIHHPANIREEVLGRRAEEAKQEAENYAETMADRIAEKEEMPKTEATTGDSYAEETKKEILREVAESEGATEEQADAYAEYYNDWYELLDSSTLEQLPSLANELEEIIGDSSITENEKRIRANDALIGHSSNEFKLLLSQYPDILENKEHFAMIIDLGYTMADIDFGVETGYDLDTQGYIFDSYASKYPELRDQFNAIVDAVNDAKDGIELYFDKRNHYWMNRDNLRQIAIRSGATEEVANSFSKYISLIADKWEKNHPGKKFFTDAPGIGNLFIDFSNESQTATGNYSVSTRILNIFQDGDFFTLMHELGHGFQYILDENQQKELAQYFGMDYDEYARLSYLWENDFYSLSKEDQGKYSYMTETFARGFVDYMQTKTAPTPELAKIFYSFKTFIRRIFPKISEFILGELYLNWDAYEKTEGRTGGFESGIITADENRNGITLRQIFEKLATEEENIENVQVGLTPEEVQISLTQGRAVPLADIDIATELESKAQTQADKDGAIQAIAQNLLNDEMLDPAYQQENAHEHLAIADYIDYLTEIVSGETNPNLSEETRARVFANIQKYDSDGVAQRQIQNIKNNLRMTDIPQSGDYVASTYTFEFGEHTIVGAVFHDGKLVAYVPKGMTETSVMISGDESVPVLGVSPEHPNQWVYKDGNEIYTEQKQQAKTENSFTGDAETDSLGALDPAGQAVHEMTYDNVVQILLEFASVYKTALNDAMANKTFGSLDAETKELVRQYIDNDVRTDLQNTKYKTGKFGEMMRDAALLNYSKRYGFDNALTLLFPYQFWNTRSAWNWINRMGGKGGKLWRRYARLKELEERNKKEIMPSRITGKIGIYLPFLPDWMGDALFMPTSQLSIVGNFIDPLDDWLTDDQPVIATAERYVQEAYDNGDISHQELLAALDPAKRAGSSAWQEAYARAQTEGDHDRDLGNLFKQYFGMSLPVSIGKAIMTGNPDDWTQTPMTRTGTAFRALFGDNIVGKGLEFAMSAPERALRKAAVALTGNNDFRYQEFGNWGDYYIRNQVWDMVVEGRISPEEAIKAQAEKDGNKVWEEAADRQRQELLQKTQLLSATMPFKKMVEDVKNGNQDKLFDDFKYLMASALTMWTPATVVRDAERTWREDKAEMSQLYETGTKEDRNKFFDNHEYYQYNNLRYEDDPEQALRSYLYKSITDRWYDLDKSEQDELKLAFGPDFQRSILDKETRAYQTMDLTRLAAYAQALNGSIPYLATDALNTMNTPKINTNVIPVNEKISHEVYLKERERLYPGMSDVSNIYYNLPVEDRKIFRQANPNLTKYWEWNRNYKSQHPEVDNYSKRMTDYYNTIEAEDVFSILDPFTIKELTRAAYTKGKVDKMYQPVIERAMASAKVSDSYDDFLKVLTDYILGE